MPRRRRICIAGFPFHLIQRGNNRSDCFRTDADRLRYLQELRVQSQRFDVAVHAYVLMTNHVHLLATPSRDDALGLMMKFLGQVYVQYFNRRHRRSGSLWEGRFRSSLVDSEGYLFTCHRYIECNPVRARMVDYPAGYEWSSHRANAEGPADPLLTLHPLVEELGDWPEQRRAAYRNLFTEELDARVLEQVRQAANGGFAIGSEAFVKRMAAATGHRLARKRRGPIRERLSGLSPNPTKWSVP